MLSLSENATTLIKRLSNSLDGTPSAGLRINAQADSPQGYAAAIVAHPEAGDEVIESDGARVYLDATASPAFTAMELDAVVEDGSVRFAFRSR